MPYRVFKQRLEYQIQCFILQNTVIYVVHHIKAVVMHGKLNIKIRLDICYLIFDKQDVFSFVQGCPVECRQRQGDPAYVFLLRLKGFPIDHRQRIIQEMRIDLGLKCPHLVFFFLDLALIYLIDSLIKALTHAVIAIYKITDLICTVIFYNHAQISCLGGLHSLLKIFDSLRYKF